MEPFARLLAAAGIQRARPGGALVEAQHHVPQRVDPFAGLGGTSIGSRPPAFGRRGQVVERAVVFGAGGLGAGFVVAVGLVDGDGVGQFHDPLLDPLQLVAAAGDEHHQEEVDHRADGDLVLARADRLDNDHIEPGRLADEHRLAGLAGHAAEHAARGRGANEGVGFAAEALHARFVAEDAAAREAAGGVDGQHRHLVTALDEAHAEGLDEGALARAGHAGDAEADGAAGMGQQAAQYVLGLLEVGRGVALDEGDGAGQHGAVAAHHAGDVLIGGQRTAGGAFGRVGRGRLARHRIHAGHDPRGERLPGIFRRPVWFSCS